MKTLFLSFALTLPLIVSSQQASIGLSLGYTTNGIGGTVEYNHHFAFSSIIHASLYFSNATIKENNLEASYNDITVNIGYFYQVLNPNRGKLKFLVGGGGLVGYEIVNNGDTTLDNGVIILADTKLIYGGYLGANLNYFISDEFSLSMVLNEFYHANSDLGNSAFYAGLGIKYYIF